MSTSLTKLEQALMQLSMYIGKPLTPADRERAQQLHLSALTECRRAMYEQQANQEQRIIQKMEGLEDIASTILIELRQKVVVVS